MKNAKAAAEMPIQVAEVQTGTAQFDGVLGLAARVLAQDQHLITDASAAHESHVLGAFDGSRCVGFLRYLIQVIGAEEGRPPVMHSGESLREGYVEAFGVDPQLRRRGIGTALQQQAARQCHDAGCYQMRSRSPVTSAENYALKVAAGYVLHPSSENDSYYFLRPCDPLPLCWRAISAMPETRATAPTRPLAAAAIRTIESEEDGRS